MISSKIASLEARLARIEKILKRSSFRHMVEMIDPRTKRVEAVDTLDNFYENNMEEEEVIEALDELKSGLKSEVLVPTGQGYYILKLK
jgi:prefoldin subunit 5